MIDLSQKKILVTGGAGFLGQQVIHQLIQAGAQPGNITVPRSSSCDLRRLEACQQAVQGQDIVIHLAAHVGGLASTARNPLNFFMTI